MKDWLSWSYQTTSIVVSESQTRSFAVGLLSYMKILRLDNLDIPLWFPDLIFSSWIHAISKTLNINLLKKNRLLVYSEFQQSWLFRVTQAHLFIIHEAGVAAMGQQVILHKANCFKILQALLFSKGLASHCLAKTTFTFHFSIINTLESIWQC